MNNVFNLIFMLREILSPVGFRPNKKAGKLLIDAVRVTKRTKTSIINECVETAGPKILSRLMGNKKSTSKKLTR